MARSLLKYPNAGMHLGHYRVADMQRSGNLGITIIITHSPEEQTRADSGPRTLIRFWLS